MRIALLILILTGCAATPTFERKRVCVDVEIVDEDLRLGKKNAYALAQPGLDPCRIRIERKHYRNEVIGHEFRHCLDGFWHSE